MSSLRSVGTQHRVLRAATAIAIVATVWSTSGSVDGSSGHAQSPRRGTTPATQTAVRLPDESAGIDAIVRALIAAFDRVDVVGLGEDHGRKLDSDVRIALVRHPDFAKKVRTIVVEFGSIGEQATLDRYVRGENVSSAQLAQVWKTANGGANGIWDAPMYGDFFAAVRQLNAMLPADAKVRVLAGDPGPRDGRSRDASAVAVVKEVLRQRGKALVIYGAAHFYKTRDYADDIGITRTLESEYPGRTLSVIPIGGPVDLPAGVTLRVSPDYQKIDRALTARVRPVLVPLERVPFRDFSAEEFMGHHVITCVGAGGCRSVFQGSTLTLGQMADAALYVGGLTSISGK